MVVKHFYFFFFQVFLWECNISMEASLHDFVCLWTTHINNLVYHKHHKKVPQFILFQGFFILLPGLKRYARQLRLLIPCNVHMPSFQINQKSEPTYIIHFLIKNIIWQSSSNLATFAKTNVLEEFTYFPKLDK